MLYAIDRLVPGGGGGVAEPLTKVAERLGRRGLVVIISDFYDDPERVRDAIGLVRATGADVLAFHLLDPAELEFPFESASAFEDLDTGDRLPVVPEDLRARYREMIRDHVGRLERDFGANRVDYALCDTSRPLDYALYAYLARRQELSRTR